MTWSIATFSASGAQDPFANFLKVAPTSLSNLEVSSPFQPQYPLIGSNTKHTLLDDSAGVRFGYLDVVTVVVGVDGTQISFSHLLALVFLEVLEVGLVAELADHIEVLLSPLTGVGHHLDRR